MQEKINLERRNFIKKILLVIFGFLASLPLIKAKNMTWIDEGIERFSTRNDYLITDGANKITVGTVEPTSPSTGDLWVDTN